MKHKHRDATVSMSLPEPVPGRSPRRGIRALTPALALGAVLVLAGCSGGADPEAAPVAASATSSSPTTPAEPTTAPPLADGAVVIAPGLPGEPATTGSPTPASGGEWNDADTVFVEMMVPHHTQALAMADLAEQHAVDPAVRAISQRIGDTQGPEVLTMSGWLDEQGIEPGSGMGGMSGMEMGEMSEMGMLTDDELDELAAARGAAFDQLFLESMIRHHQGAIAMADDVLVEGSDIRVAELAADVNAGQSAEITRMQEMLGS